MMMMYCLIFQGNKEIDCALTHLEKPQLKYCTSANLSLCSKFACLASAEVLRGLNLSVPAGELRVAAWPLAVARPSECCWRLLLYLQWEERAERGSVSVEARGRGGEGKRVQALGQGDRGGDSGEWRAVHQQLNPERLSGQEAHSLPPSGLTERQFTSRNVPGENGKQVIDFNKVCN